MSNVILPERDNMLKRLLAVSNEPHFQERLYPALINHAGRELAPTGVLMMLSLAIYDYCAEMPPIMGCLVNMHIPAFIDALVTDEAAAEHIKQLYEQMA
jgi:hypothetical protein